MEQCLMALELSSEMRDTTTVTFSPLSITSLLSVLMLGTSGISYQQIYTALGLPPGIDEASIHSNFKQLIDSIIQSSQGVTLNIANGIFVRKGVHVLYDFSRSVREVYAAQVRVLDFEKNSVAATNTINDWVKNKTSGMISQLLGQPLSPQTEFVAVNTLFFNGIWEFPFIPDLTINGPFQTGSEIIQVPMMRAAMTLRYIDIPDLNAHMVELPYVGGKFSMYILMSHGPVSSNLQELELRIRDATSLNNYIRDMVETSVSVSLPRMRLSYKLSLKEVLKALRVSSIFDNVKADFGRLTASEHVWVDDVIHETVVEVTEVGTKAASATSVSINRVASAVTFMVNRPAMLFIRDLPSGLPLFWCRLVKPEPLA
ncbi:serpin B11 isoform X2 [Cherax quadricarinatus]|uniref:serpin B11 isoform X2 n=1 Tax=Cherax quadricarinatus TaxID=27406 RepID=UPI002377D8D4|nr:serpin B8-like isoform X2 [Cherax quadricarinatus]